MQAIMTEFYSGCGSKKFCLGPERGCEEELECSYFVSISVSFNESVARFQMTKKGLGYVAVGLSYNEEMVRIQYSSYLINRGSIIIKIKSTDSNN